MNSNKKTLYEEYEKLMEETKGVLTALALTSSVMEMDADEVVANVKAFQLFSRTLDLCGAFLKKQEDLMDKMNRALNKYLMA